MDFTILLSLQKLLRYPTRIRVCLHKARNNGNNGNVAYVSLDLTFALICVANDNALQHRGEHLLRTYFSDSCKCVLRSQN